MRSVPRPKLAALAVILGIAAGTSHAGAQETVTPDGAAALAAALDSGIRVIMPTPENGGPFTWRGTVQAVPAGDLYEVMLPDLSILNARNGSRLTLGEIALKLRPAANGSYELVNAVLPATVRLVDAQGQEHNDRITIGRQQISGIWVPRYETFTTLDAVLGDIQLGRDTFTNIGAITLRGALTPEGDDLWGGPFELTIQDIRGIDTQKGDLIAIEQLGMSTIGHGIDLARQARMSRRMRELQGMADSPEAAAAPILASILHELLSGLPFKDFGVSLSLKGVNIGKFDKTEMLKIADAGFQISLSGVKDERSSLSLGYRHAGLNIATPTPIPDEFVPAMVELNTTAANLPNAELWKIVQGLVGTIESGNDVHADVFAALLAPQLLGMLSEAGSEVRLDKLAVAMPAAGGVAAGTARIDSQAPYGMTGAFDVTLRGLDAVLTRLKPVKGQKVDKETQNMAGALSLIQALGQPGKDAQGQQIRTYRIEIDADGQMMVNGNDLTALTKGMPQ